MFKLTFRIHNPSSNYYVSNIDEINDQCYKTFSKPKCSPNLTGLTLSIQD